MKSDYQSVDADDTSVNGKRKDRPAVVADSDSGEELETVLKSWQRELTKHASEADDRTIHWMYSPKGNMGMCGLATMIHDEGLTANNSSP